MNSESEREQSFRRNGTRSQKASKEKVAMLKVEIHPNIARDETKAERRTAENENSRLTSESTPVEQGHDFATSNGTSNLIERRCRNCPKFRLKMQQGRITY